MGERITVLDGPLAESRDKAATYLADGQTFAFAHAIDHRLALGRDPMILAVSYCASQILKDDKELASEDLVKTSKIPFTGFLQRRIEANMRVLDLTEDFLDREREKHRMQNMPDRSDEYNLAIRQAVQGLFVIERAKTSIPARERNQRVEEWGSHWRAQIQRYV